MTPVAVSTEFAAEDVTKAYGAAVGKKPTEPELEAVKEATTTFSRSMPETIISIHSRGVTYTNHFNT